MALTIARQSARSPGHRGDHDPLHFSLALILLLAPLASCDKAPPPPQQSAVLDAAFTYDGRPYPAKLTLVADNPSGRPTRTERTGTRATLQVPGRATLTVDALLPPAGGDSVVFRDIIPEFAVPTGETLHVQFTLPTPATHVPFAPALLMSGVNANAIVSNEVTRDADGRATLSSTVRAAPGTPVILDGYYFGLDASGGIEDPTARDFICADPCAHVFPQNVDCSFHCATCSSTQKIVGNVYKGNFNMCEIRAPSSGGDPIVVRSTFTSLAAGDGGVHLTVLLRDGRAISPHRLELVRLTDGSRTTIAAPNFSRRFPEFVTKAGDHQYEITPLGDSSASLRLPVAITDGRVTGLHVELPDVAALAEHQPIVVADTRLGVIRREGTTRPTDDGVVLHLVARGSDVGTAWVLLPLAADARVRAISIREDDGPVRPLREGTDYIAQTVGNRPAVIVRSGARQATFALQLSASRPAVPE